MGYKGKGKQYSNFSGFIVYNELTWLKQGEPRSKTVPELNTVSS